MLSARSRYMRTEWNPANLLPMCVCVCVRMSSFSDPFDEGDLAVEMGVESLQIHPLPSLKPWTNSWWTDV